MKIKLWAIIDTSGKDGDRFCYADANKTNGAMALYDKKPKIQKDWKPFKKVVKVSVEIVDNASQLIKDIPNKEKA